MGKVTIREIRLHWPKVEKRLRVEHHLIITRDGTPVAVMSEPPRHDATTPKQFEAKKQSAWLRKQWKNHPTLRSSDQMLAEERDE